MNDSSLRVSPLIWLLVPIPFFWLLSIYDQLPAEIPIHYNSRGEADGYGPKAVLWMLPMIPLITTFAMIYLVPAFDRENNLAKMGKKYESLTFMLVGIMNALAVYFIQNAGKEQLQSFSLVMALLGLILLVIGNFLPSIRPNYAMGFRLPWTLKSEAVWRKTHRLAGKLWVIGGTAIILLAFLMPIELSRFLFIFIILTICLIPSVYSYRLYKAEEDDPLI